MNSVMKRKFLIAFALLYASTMLPSCAKDNWLYKIAVGPERIYENSQLTNYPIIPVYCISMSNHRVRLLVPSGSTIINCPNCSCGPVPLKREVSIPGPTPSLAPAFAPTMPANKTGAADQ